MGKFDDLSFYSHEDEELQKEWERMFGNMAKKKKNINDKAEERSYDYQRELSMYDSCSDDHIVARRLGYKDGYVDGHKEMKDKILEWVKSEMERLWELLPDADNDKPTEMELRYLGQYMQMESLELFLETL